MTDNTVTNTTTDFGFEFDAGNPEQKSGGEFHSNVDWNALNDYVAETVGVGKQSLIGTISQIYDLGEQEREDYEEVWKGDDAQKNKLENYEGAHLGTGSRGDGKGKECLIYPQKPVRQISFAIDFYEKMLDKGQFFSDDENREPDLKPYRMVMGREWFKTREGKRVNVIAKPFNVVHTNLNRDKKGDHPTLWSFAKNNGVYKLAEKCGILNEDGSFQAKDIGKLLGKRAMFEVELKWNTWTKDGEERKMLKEFVNVAGMLSDRDRKFADEELVIDPELIGGLNMHKENREIDIKMARKIVKDTMSFATDWEGSVLQKQIANLGNSNSSDSDEDKDEKEPSVQTPAPQVNPQGLEGKGDGMENELPDVDFDDDQCPF